MKFTFILLVGVLRLSAFSQEQKVIPVSGDVEVVRLSEHAWLHITYETIRGYGRVGANGLILTNQGKAMLFDSPWNDAQTRLLVEWVKDSLKAELTGFVPNHWHEDCMGGLGYLQKIRVPSWANQRTIDIAKAKDLPVPEHGFTDSLKLSLGDMTIWCFAPGAAHSLDNIAVWIPSEKILFAGCMVKALSSPNLGNTVDGDLKAYPVTLGKIQKKFGNTALIVIPGHGDPGGPELISHTLELSGK